MATGGLDAVSVTAVGTPPPAPDAVGHTWTRTRARQNVRIYVREDAG